MRGSDGGIGGVGIGVGGGARARHCCQGCGGGEGGVDPSSYNNRRLHHRLGLEPGPEPAHRKSERRRAPYRHRLGGVAGIGERRLLTAPRLLLSPADGEISAAAEEEEEGKELADYSSTFTDGTIMTGARYADVDKDAGAEPGAAGGTSITAAATIAHEKNGAAVGAAAAADGDDDDDERHEQVVNDGGIDERGGNRENVDIAVAKDFERGAVEVDDDDVDDDEEGDDSFHDDDEEREDLDGPGRTAAHLRSSSAARDDFTNRNAEGNSAPSSPFLERLTQNTLAILDLNQIPLGQLTSDDVTTITGLMAAWARRKSTRGANTVERLLKRIVDDMKFNANAAAAANDDAADGGGIGAAGSDPGVCVTTRMYTMAIDAWAKVGGTDAAQRAHEIHEGMVETYRQTGDAAIQPSTISYNAVINAWSKSRSARAPFMVEVILAEMTDVWRKEGDGCGVKPDVVSFTSCIDTWAKSGKPGAGQRGLKLLRKMEEMAAEAEERDGGSSLSAAGDDVRPNVYTYSAAINAFAKSPDVDAPRQAERLLEHMKSLYKAGDWQSKPNCINYNSVINAWGRCREPGSAQRATEVLERMERPVSEGGDDVEPDALSYSLAVSAWAHSPDSDAARRGEEMLTRMERWAVSKTRQLEESGALPGHRIRLDVEAYNTVLITLSRCNEDDAPLRALALLSRMLDLAEAGFETARPNARSWNSVLNAFSRKREPGIALKAERVLNWMYQEGIKPDEFSFAAVLHAYQKNAEPGSAQRADGIIRRMEELHRAGELDHGPDVFHYTIVCACWARSGEAIAARRCGQILDHMIGQAETGKNELARPNTRTYNAVVDAYARSRDVETAEALLDRLIESYRSGDKGLKPDSFTFNAVINAWTRSRRRDGGKRAEVVLDKLLKFHRRDLDDGKRDVVPDSRSFSHIIDYYGKRRELDAPMRAEKILNRMIEMFDEGYTALAPNIFSFVSVINAYANSKQSYSGKCANRVLQHMVDLYEKHGITKLKPNTFIMNAVLQAWAHTGDDEAGPMAEEILLGMEKSYEEGDADLKPNARTYGLVISCWAKSSLPGKAEEALRVLHRMEEHYDKSKEGVRPNVHAFNAVINACAFTNGSESEQRKAFELAQSTLQKLYECQYAQPIGATFGTFMKACGRLKLPREVVATNLDTSFKKCCELGLVTDFVLTQLRYSSPDGIYRQLLGDLVPKDGPEKVRIEVDAVPFEWRRNIPEQNQDDNIIVVNKE